MTSGGGFWNEKNWRNRKFYPFLEEIGIQPNPYDENGKRKPEFFGKLATYTPYTTRHTYASLCDRAGVNKDYNGPLVKTTLEEIIVNTF